MLRAPQSDTEVLPSQGARAARARGTLSPGGRMRRAGALALSALAACWHLLPAVARAQSVPRAPASLNGDGADTHLFRPAVDSKGFFSVNGTRILPANGISFGLVLDYGRSILR